MASSAAIKSGEGYVSMGMDLTPLMQGMHTIKNKLRAFGAGVMAAGQGMLATGLAMGGMLTPGIVMFADYEQALADLKASGGEEAIKQFDAIKDKIEQVAKATGVAPVEVTQGFSELIKAGLDVQKVIGGVGEAAIKFARVSGVPMAESATVLIDAMNIFARDGLSAARVADIINQAADATTLSLKDVTESFAQGGSSMGTYNQNMFDTATAIALMSKGAIKGAQAGTALKTLMTRLVTGKSDDEGAAGDEVSQAMSKINLKVFDDLTGNVLPIPEILRRINVGLAGLATEQERLSVQKGLAGMKGIQGLLPMLKDGARGWAEMQEKMSSSLTVEQKFAMMTDTLWGQFKRLWVHVQFVAIAVGEALAPALRTVSAAAMPLLSILQGLIKHNQALVQAFAFDAVKAVAFGAALIGIGATIKILAMGLGLISTAIAVIPGVIVFGGILTILYLLSELVPEVAKAIGSFLGGAFTQLSGVMSSVMATVKENFAGVVELINAGEIKEAFELAKMGMQISWLQFKSFILQVWDEIVDGIVARFIRAQEGVFAILNPGGWLATQIFGGPEVPPAPAGPALPPVSPAVQAIRDQIAALEAQQRIRREEALWQAEGARSIEEHMAWITGAGPGTNNTTPPPLPRSALQGSALGTFSRSAIGGMFGSRDPMARVATAAEEQVAIQLRQERLQQEIRDAQRAGFQWR